MPIPPLLQQFDFANATVSMWLYKKSFPNGLPRFKGRWIETDEHLDQALKNALIAKRNSIIEVEEYGLLANVEVGQALHIDTMETHATLITQEAAAEVASKKATKLKEVKNTDFYVVKLVNGDQVIHAVRKTDQSWKSKKTTNLLNVLFEDDRLGLNTAPDFNISRDVDFFIVGNDVIITDKGAFESILSYRAAHEEDFVALQAEPAFIEIFSDTAPLVQYVGTNKLHLRRACAIHAKGYYADPAYMARLRNTYQQSGLNLVFDPQGRLVVTPETCADVMRALLNHRLLSTFSESYFDVPNATAV